MDPNLTLLLRAIVVALHIIFVVFWLAGIVANYGFRKLLNSNSDRQQMLAIRMAQLRVNDFGGAIGGPGVLVTGLILLGLDRYGFLGFGPTPAWLFIKQLGYVLALVLVFTVINPTSKKVNTLMQDKAKNGDIAEMQALLPRLMLFGNISHLIVVINILLAAWGVRGGLQDIINWFG